MALIMKSLGDHVGQAAFFTQVFGETHEVTTQAKSLIAAGVKFDVLLYSVQATLGGKVVSQVQTASGTTALMKHTVEPFMADADKKVIQEWVAKLVASNVVISEVASQGPTKLLMVGITASTASILPIIKVVQSLTGKSLTEAKHLVEGVSQQGMQATEVAVYGSQYEASKAAKLLHAVGVVAKLEPAAGPIPVAAVKEWAAAAKPVPATTPWPATVKPVPSVIDLKHAAALGQKVHGTSPGSVYYCIALSEHVKVAARLNKGGAVSIRAEWTDNPTGELQKLQEAGVQMKKEYGSIHFDASGVQLQRVVGAFLVGTGINWKAAVMNGAELVIGDQ